MKEIKTQKRGPFRKHALMFACVLAATVHAQTSRPNSGVLLKPQSTLMLGATCQVSQLQLRIRTGNDDLRGGNNNLNLQIHFADGGMQSANNVNKNANWPNNSTNVVSVSLSKPVSPSQIKDITLIHSAQAGYNPPSGRQAALSASPVSGPLLGPIIGAQGIQSEDNWDMTELQAFALGKGINVPVASFGFHRFTGSSPSLDIPAQSGIGCPTGKQVTKVSFTFTTSDDDLRGGNDNLNIAILFTDGTSQAANNVNHSQNWPNNSTKGAEILLNRLVTIDQIRGFTLEDTFTGGSGGDNWNMASMQADAVFTDGSYRTIAQSGFHRFSSDWSGPKAKQITIAAHPIN
jgi:hypothetical protein